MTVRSFERSRLEPIPFPICPLQINGYTVPAGDANASSARVLSWTTARHGRVAPSTVGCLRGFFWGVVLECTVAFCAYEAWHLLRFLR
jgi:hypothetical protein